MTKLKEVFVCQNCGSPSPKWQGQCPTCGEWNTLLADTAPQNSRSGHSRAGHSRAGQKGNARPSADVSTSLAAEATAEEPRLTTGSAELDRVLGGGLVLGSVTLIGGDPGIGKSTLMLQAAAALNALGPVLYATGEESLQQVALRARRLGLADTTARLLAATGVEEIVGVATALQARVLIVDSIQTMYSERVESAPGAVSQLRECTAELVASPSRAARPCCWWVTSPRKARSPVPACSSTWSTRCFTSKATRAAASACCAR
jgi:DNA repair protein RadA/Sms